MGGHHQPHPEKAAIAGGTKVVAVRRSREVLTVTEGAAPQHLNFVITNTYLINLVFIIQAPFPQTARHIQSPAFRRTMRVHAHRNRSP